MEIRVKDISGYLKVYFYYTYSQDRILSSIFHTKFCRENDYLIPKELGIINNFLIKDQPILNTNFKASKTYICQKDKIFENNGLFFDYVTKQIDEYGCCNIQKSNATKNVLRDIPRCGGNIIEVDYTVKYKNLNDYVFILNSARKRVK